MYEYIYIYIYICMYVCTNISKNLDCYLIFIEKCVATILIFPKPLQYFFYRKVITILSIVSKTILFKYFYNKEMFN